MGSMVAGDRVEIHRASGHSCVLFSAEWRLHFRPMARPAPANYGGVVTSAARSFLAEPPPPHAPAPLRRDWVLVASRSRIGSRDHLDQNHAARLDMVLAW